MNALFVAFLLISSTLETPLMTRDGVLVRLDASLVVTFDSRAKISVTGARCLLLPSQGQVRGRNDLDEVHVVEGLLVCVLICPIQRVDVVVCPSARASREVLLCHVLHNDIAQLRTETQVVDLVGKSVRVLVLEVVLEVVHVEVAVREGLSGGDVEVANDLVDLDAALEAASLLALFVKVLSVVFTLALLHTLATTERP